MDNSILIVLVAVAISLVSIVLVVASNSSLQTNLINLNRDVVEQSQTITSLSSRLDTDNQVIESLSSKLKASEQLLEFQNKTITYMQNNIANLTGKISSLEERMMVIEQKIKAVSPKPFSDTLEFKPETVVDGKGMNWTSHYIKQDLYDPMVTPYCSSPIPDCYVHISKVTTPSGNGIEVDTNNSQDYGYYLLAYSDEYVVPSDGLVTISGKFLKRDQLPPVNNSSNPNALVSVYILGEDPNKIISTDLALTSDDQNNVWHEKRLNFTLEKEKIFRIGIGRNDGWSANYKLYASWSDISTNAQPKR